MRSYFARQPIFDRELHVVAYELLFREGFKNAFRAADQAAADQASLTVMRDSIVPSGLETLSDGKRVFINFTRETLLGEFALLFSKEVIVVEILENVEPEADVIAACRNLKDAGYTLALDDVVDIDPDYGPLLELASIIKVDFPCLTPGRRSRLSHEFRGRGLEILAEKVETRADQDQAMVLGYDYMQGFFFSEPVIIAHDHLPESKQTAMRLMQAVNRPEIDHDEVETIIKSDIGISFRLLCYVNSPFFGLRMKVQSIRRALVLLGTRHLRKWGALVAFASLDEPKSRELIMTSLVRARMCELLAPEMDLNGQDQELFLLGMFSMVDALVGMDLEMILNDMSLEGDLRDALLARRGPLRPALDISLASEQGDWEMIEELSGRLGMIETDLSQAYFSSIDWAQQFVCASAGASQDRAA